MLKSVILESFLIMDPRLREPSSDCVKTNLSPKPYDSCLHKHECTAKKSSGTTMTMTWRTLRHHQKLQLNPVKMKPTKLKHRSLNRAKIARPRNKIRPDATYRPSSLRHT